MTIQTLPEQAVLNVIKAMHWYVERTTQYPRVVPIASAPERRFNEFYRTPKGAPPGLSMTDGEIFPTATFLERYIAPMTYVISDFDLPSDIIRLTESFGMPVLSQTSESIFKQFAQRAAQVVYQGTGAIEPANASGASSRGADSGLKGLTNIASPSGLNTSTYTSVKWNAAFGPQNALRNMAGLNEVDGFDAPWGCVLSNGLQDGLWYTITNTAETNWRGVHEILTGTDAGPGAAKGGTLFFENLGVENTIAGTGNTVNPLPAASSNDGVALILKPTPSCYQLLIGVPPSLDLGPMDTHSRVVPGKAIMQIGMVIPEPMGVAKHVTVDLA